MGFPLPFPFPPPPLYLMLTSGTSQGAGSSSSHLITVILYREQDLSFVRAYHLVPGALQNTVKIKNLTNRFFLTTKLPFLIKPKRNAQYAS
jgi:hypothetical protein